jgi:mono/diheme cytochrome c family protein
MLRAPLPSLLLTLGLLASLPGIAGEETLLQRGAYLTETIAACGNCHTPKRQDAVPIESLKFAGGFVIEEPAFKAYAPNITMDEETGIGSWTDEEIIRAIREGLRPDGSVIGPPMPSLYYRSMSDYDVKAIVAYLRTIKPVTHTTPKSEYRISLPDSWGAPLESVPEVSKTNKLAYATYVAETLGHCNDCHTPMVEGKHDFTRVGLGGNPYIGNFELDVAAISANITPHSKYGVANWTDEQLKTAISEGVRPDGRQLAPIMGFHYYKNINEEDLNALVYYMRNLKPQPAD